MCSADSSVGNYELYVSKYSVVSTDLKQQIWLFTVMALMTYDDVCSICW